MTHLLLCVQSLGSQHIDTALQGTHGAGVCSYGMAAIVIRLWGKKSFTHVQLAQQSHILRRLDRTGLRHQWSGRQP